ncbi:Histidine kinase [Thalictrum thalictroides]|uniref:histidine kinase n=1 Tax=Thalictrum thalictroides TaxID=46969 RepID=A0A7J6VT92_THATH|nr:Histidine kinase [Thalictrum thalictroides]
MCLQQVFGEKNQVKPPFLLQSLLNGNIVNRRVADGPLINYGAKVTCVERGKTAIKMLQLPPQFDACFMDLQMPEMEPSTVYMLFKLKFMSLRSYKCLTF